MSTLALAPSARRGRGTLSVPVRAVFEVLTLAALLLPALWLAAHWAQLPARVPTRFDLAGHVVAHGAKASLWFVWGASLLMYVLLGAVSFFPQVYNLPASRNDPRRPGMEHLAIEMMLTLRLEVVTLFGLVTLAGAVSAWQAREAIGPALFPGEIAVIGLTTVLFLVGITRVRA